MNGNSESPMLRRVRTGKLNRISRYSGIRLRIPRKGRIRLFLIVLLLFAGVKIFSNRESKEPTLPLKARALPVAIEPHHNHSETTPPQTANEKHPIHLHSVSTPAVTVKQHHDQAESVTSVPLHQRLLKYFGIMQKTRPQEIPFSRENVADLLKKHYPAFQSFSDTFSENNKRYIIYYSLDSTLQHCGETLLKRYHPKYGSLVAMEPGTGRVLSLISYTREGEDSLGNNLYCRSIFPAASVFKTITAAGAIEKAHIRPESTFSLAGRRYTLYKFQLAPELRSYQYVSFEDAYSMSINPVFGRIGIYVLGTKGLKEYMRRFGFNCRIPFDLENENPYADENIKDSLLIIAETASGFNKITRISPLFGALIASSISENGVMPIPSVVDSVVIFDSCTIYRMSPKEWRTPVNANTASELKCLMSRVVRNGTARSSFRYIRNSPYFDDVEYGGKTGTVDDDTLGKIDWFIGFAKHANDLKKRLAVGIVTVHDEFWTVHSSYIAEELFRAHIRGIKIANKKRKMQNAEDEEDDQDLVTNDTTEN